MKKVIETNVIRFVKAAINQLSPKEYIKVAFGGCSLSFMGIAMGLIGGFFWRVIAIFMLFLCFLTLIMVFILSRKKLTVKRRLIIEDITYVNALLQTLLSITSMQTKWFGMNAWILLIYFPVGMNMFLWWFISRKDLKQEKLSQKPLRGKIFIGFIIAVGVIFVLWAVISLGTMGQNANQDPLVILVIGGFMILCMIIAAGVAITTLRLYYCIRYEKKGISFECCSTGDG